MQLSIKDQVYVYKRMSKRQVVDYKLHIHILQSRSNISDCIFSLDESKCSYTIINNFDKGIMSGRLIGFEQSDSEFVSFVDDDDQTLLNPDIIYSLTQLNKPALFTNSLMISPTGRSNYQVPISINNWTLHLEKRGYIRPHQTIIYRRDILKDLIKDTCNLIYENNWSENDFDIIMRFLVSANIGWHYEPIITYKWMIHMNGDHFKRQPRILEIRKFILGE